MLEYSYSDDRWEEAIYSTKGSITVDGVSLTVNNITDSTIDLMIIPHTFKNTTIKYYKEGQTVNIELDYIAKYIVNMSNVNDN